MSIVDYVSRNWALASLIIYIINIILLFTFNPFDVINNYTQSVIFSVVFIGFLNSILWYYFKYIIKDNNQEDYEVISFMSRVLIFITSIFLFMALLFFVTYFFILSSVSVNLIITILNIAILVGLLAMGYKFFSNLINPNTNIGMVVELLVNIIFFIPCLLIEFIEFIKHEYKITTKTVWLILLFEIIVIGLRFGVPYLYTLYNKFMINANGSLLKDGPIYLNEETTLGVFQDYTSEDETKNKNFNYNFALSSWIWINPQPESTSDAYNKRTSLLNYGDILQINFNKNKIEVFAATTQNSIEDPNKLVKVYETDILYQRWNNFVINYFGGTLDLFINNELVISKINITPILFPNKVTCGSKNGINGGIKNIIYYDNILTKPDIASIYNKL